MKSHNNNRLTVFLLIAITLVSIGIYISNYSQISNKSELSSTNNENSSLDQKVVAANGNIFYAKIIDGNTEIYQILSDKTEKLIYKDNDESDKIKYILGLTNLDEIIAFMSPKDANFIGSLYNISPKGKLKLDFQFATYQSPAISPDGNTIAYVTFSNVEFDYGFKLLVSDTNGENIVKISQIDTPISDFSFSDDSSKIAYQLGNAIYIYDLISSSNEKIYLFQEDATLVHLYWNNNSNILALRNTNDSTASMVYNIDIKNKSAQKLFTSDKTIKSKPVWYGDDFTSFYYITGDGALKLHTEEKDIDITNADILISWRP